MEPEKCKTCGGVAVFRIQWGTAPGQCGEFCETCTASLWDRVRANVSLGTNFWTQEDINGKDGNGKPKTERGTEGAGQ